MTTREKRMHYRVDSQNLLNYLCYDETDTVARQGMGKTLNVSETGILLETHIALDSGCRVAITLGLEEELVDLGGKVVYSKPGAEGKFESGIQFHETDEAGKRVLAGYIQAFRGL